MKEILVILTFLISTSALALPGIPTSNDLSSGLYNSLVKNQYHSKCIEVSNTKSALQDLFNSGEKLDCSANTDDTKFCSCLDKISTNSNNDLFNKELASLMRRKNDKLFKNKIEACNLIEKAYGNGLCSELKNIEIQSKKKKHSRANMLIGLNESKIIETPVVIIQHDKNFITAFQKAAVDKNLKGTFEEDKEKLKEIHQQLMKSINKKSVEHSPLFKIFTSNATDPGWMIYDTIQRLDDNKLTLDNSSIISKFNDAKSHSGIYEKLINPGPINHSPLLKFKEDDNQIFKTGIGVIKFEKLKNFNFAEKVGSRYGTAGYNASNHNMKAVKKALAMGIGTNLYGSIKEYVIKDYDEDDLDISNKISNTYSLNNVNDLAKQRDELYSYLSTKEKDKSSSKQLFNFKFDQFYCSQKRMSQLYTTKLSQLINDDKGIKLVKEKIFERDEEYKEIEKAKSTLERSNLVHKSLKDKKAYLEKELDNLTFSHEVAVDLYKQGVGKIDLAQQVELGETVDEYNELILEQKNKIDIVNSEIVLARKKEREATIILGQHAKRASRKQSSLAKALQKYNNPMLNKIFKSSSNATTEIIESANKLVTQVKENKQDISKTTDSLTKPQKQHTPTNFKTIQSQVPTNLNTYKQFSSDDIEVEKAETRNAPNQNQINNYSLLEEKIKSLRSKFSEDIKNNDKQIKTSKDNLINRPTPVAKSKEVPTPIEAVTAPSSQLKNASNQSPAPLVNARKSYKNSPPVSQISAKTPANTYIENSSNTPNIGTSNVPLPSNQKSYSSAATSPSSKPSSENTLRATASNTSTFSLSQLEPVTITDEQEIVKLGVIFNDLSPIEQQAHLEKLLDESDKESLLIEVAEGHIVKFDKKSIKKEIKKSSRPMERVRGLNTLIQKSTK